METRSKVDVPSTTKRSGQSSLKFLCVFGSMVAVIMVFSFNLHVHTGIKVDQNPVTEFMFGANFSDPELSEEDIVDDPLTDMLLSGSFEADDDGDNDFENDSSESLDGEDDYSGPVRVALYVGPGTTRNARNNIPVVLRKCSQGNIEVLPFSDASMSGIGKKKHDVIFIPGGSAGRIYSEMSSKAKHRKVLSPKNKIQRFLTKGGGYIGICAGAYLAAGGKSGNSPLKISMFRTESGMLGDGYVSSTKLDPQVETSPLLHKGLSNDLLRNSKLFYANGPIFKNTTRAIDKFTSNPQAIIRMDNDAELRILYGTSRGKSTHKRHRGLPLVVANDYGKGKVVLSTTHPETDVHHLTYDHWKKAHKPSQCSSAEAQTLVSMVYIAARRNPAME